MNKPRLLENNRISSVLDFSALQLTGAQLATKTYTIGGVSYVFGTNVFVDDQDAAALIPPSEIALAIAAAINFDPAWRGMKYSVSSANPNCEAYVDGAGKLTIVSRTSDGVTFGGDATGLGGSTFVPTGFKTATLTTSYSQISGGAGCKSFSIENLSLTLLIRCIVGTNEVSGETFDIAPQFGQVLEGSPSLYSFKGVGGSVNVQLKFNF